MERMQSKKQPQVNMKQVIKQIDAFTNEVKLFSAATGKPIKEAANQTKQGKNQTKLF